jgi:hypothetical protein
MVGIIVLVLGLVGAGLVYGLGKPPEVLPDELTNPGGYKKSARAMDTMYGRMGGFSYALTQDLKDPLIQAAIIAVGSVIVATGCFWVAEMKKRGEGR